MRTSKCAFSAAVALRRVFIHPIDPPSRTILIRTQTSPLLPICRVNTHRNYAIRTYSPSSNTDTSAKFRLPRDDEITSRYIHLVDENGKLSEPLQTARVRASINPKTHSLVTVAQPPRMHRAAEEEADEVRDEAGQPRIPICRIQSKQAMRDHEKASQKQKKDPLKVTKTLELNWAIDKHDLEHRLGRLKEFLERGHRVEVVMASKRRGKKATPEEAEAVVKKIRAAIKEVDGAKEWRAMDGKVLSQATIYIEGKHQT